MKIGDKVRFLNAVGGGIVKRFQGKDVVYVEEADGFETPVLIRECIVIDPEDLQVKSSSKATVQNIETQRTEAEKIKEVQKKKSEIIEIPGGDKLNIYLAFLPVDIKNLGKTEYESFLINDSNYFLFFNYMTKENNAMEKSLHTAC